MKRGLIIGTSHTAALRTAWRQWGDDWPDLALDFAAMHGDIDDFLVQGTQLTARTPKALAVLTLLNGQTQFDLTTYDFIAVCGGTASGYHGNKLYISARWSGLPSVQGPSPNYVLISRACFQTALCGLIRAAPATPLLQALAAATPARLFAIPHPALSHDALTKAGRTGGAHPFLGFVRIWRNGDAAAMAAMLNAAALQACEGLATYVPPPASLRRDDFFTHGKFRRGATRLGADDTVPQPPDDFLHGNADYGRHVLRALADLV